MKILKQWEERHGKTIGKTYKNNIDNFIETANFEITKATYNDIVAYISMLRKTGIAGRNLKNKLSAIKFYYNCLLEFGHMDHHPCKSLLLQDRIDRSIAVETLFSAKELETFVERENPCLPKHKLRNRIIRQLLVHQALLVNELVKLKVQNIDLEKGTLNTENGRTLRLESTQILALDKYIHIERLILKNQKKTDILLLSKSGNPIPSETVSETINYKAKVRYSPIKIRQSVISNLLKAGKGLREVQLFAGHKYISSTEKYLSNDLTELRGEIEKHHPLKGF